MRGDCMAVRVEISVAACEAKVKGACKKAVAMVSSEILRDCNEFVKVDKHTLEASSIIYSNTRAGHLVWNTVYARRQHDDIETAYKDQNPKASWKWTEMAKGQYKDRWARQFEKAVQMNL